MTPESKNLIAASILSMLVLIGWQVYFVEPELQAERDAYNQAQTQSDLPSATAEVSATAALTDAPARPSDDATRIMIETPSITGSLTTKGARLDDVILTSYRETLDEDSDKITLLRKISDNTPYFAEFGWIGAGIGHFHDCFSLRSTRSELRSASRCTSTHISDWFRF